LVASQPPLPPPDDAIPHDPSSALLEIFLFTLPLFTYLQEAAKKSRKWRSSFGVDYRLPVSPPAPFLAHYKVKVSTWD
jgi:hypothetical protein